MPVVKGGIELTDLPIPASLKCALVLILKQFDVNYLTLDPSHV